MEHYYDLRLLCLHRVRSAERNNEPLLSPVISDHDQVIADGIMGMGSDNEWIDLVARFCRLAIQHHYETPLAENRTIEEVYNDHVLLTTRDQHTDQLERWLSSFGFDADVLEQSELRRAMAHKLVPGVVEEAW